MRYPEDFTEEDVMEFEYEYNRLRDMDEGRGLWAVNALLQEIANEEYEVSIRNLIIDLQEEIQLGVLSFAEIARKYEVPTSWVNEAWEMLCEQEAEEERYAGYSHDELERDHDEPYEPDYADSWYDEQYELDTDYV